MVYGGIEMGSDVLPPGQCGRSAAGAWACLKGGKVKINKSQDFLASLSRHRLSNHVPGGEVPGCDLKPCLGDAGSAGRLGV